MKRQVGGSGEGEDVHGGHEVSDAALGSSVQRAALAELVSDVFREYQRQLWDPALGLGVSEFSQFMAAYLLRLFPPIDRLIFVVFMVVLFTALN